MAEEIANNIDFLYADRTWPCGFCGYAYELHLHGSFCPDKAKVTKLQNGAIQCPWCGQAIVENGGAFTHVDYQQPVVACRKCGRPTKTVVSGVDVGLYPWGADTVQGVRSLIFNLNPEHRILVCLRCFEEALELKEIVPVIETLFTNPSSIPMGFTPEVFDG